MKLLAWIISFWPKPKQSPLAVKVKEARDYLGLNFKDTAKLAGVTPEELQKFEEGL